MKFEQLIMFLVLLMTATLTGGCGTIPIKKPPVPVKREMSGVERNFAIALQYIRTGNESGAREHLENIVNKSPLVGVTDEALFRLAILSLRDGNSKGEIGARKLLERLLTEFPKSIWSHQADPLLEYIQETADLRASMRELKALRSHNLSLSRDNKDLRQSIERIKNLDLELEMKIRR